ncbi:1,4-dihydroxy-6-naphthoate synthase [Vicingaceae bacterium]|nr:1,4-dihydroxy-6-naphthoate synthase [Vicingaceae bacterium]
MNKLTLGFSPCPNDTFIFDAMVQQKIDTEGLGFEVVLGDVEELNDKAFKQQLDITKLSYHAMAFCLNDYQLLHSGSALGSGVGPLLIAREKLSSEQINAGKIAIPGKYTTANFLLSMAYPKAKNKQEVLFSEIEKMVLDGKVDAGLIIHENRFTYAEKGLEKIIDLGDFWEKESGGLIPLGGIVLRRSFDKELQQKVNRVLRRSIEFAIKNPSASREYVRQHAQEMDEGVTQKHINLYVNDYSLDLGEKGRSAVENLFSVAIEKNLIKEVTQPIFVEK